MVTRSVGCLSHYIIVRSPCSSSSYTKTLLLIFGDIQIYIDVFELIMNHNKLARNIIKGKIKCEILQGRLSTSSLRKLPSYFFLRKTPPQYLARTEFIII
jgi:hypothetical protein